MFPMQIEGGSFGNVCSSRGDRCCMDPAELRVTGEPSSELLCSAHFGGRF